MENYEEFTKRQAGHIRSNITEMSEPETSQLASAIRFHGLPILPAVVRV